MMLKVGVRIQRSGCAHAVGLSLLLTDQIESLGNLGPQNRRLSRVASRGLHPL
jgi:hypothetical protein